MFQDGYIVLNCVGVYEPHPLPEPALNERKYGAILECSRACTKHQANQGVRVQKRRGEQREILRG